MAPIDTIQSLNPFRLPRWRRWRVARAAMRGFARAVDMHAIDRMLEASRAEASLCAALHSMHAGAAESEAAKARMRAARDEAQGDEARFVWVAGLHAVGDSERVPTLAGQGLAMYSMHWRSHRRKLRRFGQALVRGGSLGGPGDDLLAEAGALLDRMRQEKTPGVGWPNAKSVSRAERRELGQVAGPGGASRAVESLRL